MSKLKENMNKKETLGGGKRDSLGDISSRASQHEHTLLQESKRSTLPTENSMAPDFNAGVSIIRS